MPVSYKSFVGVSTGTAYTMLMGRFQVYWTVQIISVPIFLR